MISARDCTIIENMPIEMSEDVKTRVDAMWEELGL